MICVMLCDVVCDSTLRRYITCPQQYVHHMLAYFIIDKGRRQKKLRGLLGKDLKDTLFVIQITISKH